MSTANAVQIGIDASDLSETSTTSDEEPTRMLRLRKRSGTALFLGIGVRVVYLGVERKQIPHLRVMGRNIRFLKLDLQPFRATFKREVGIAKTK